MPLRLTPKQLELAYELLRATPPLNRWRLPHADEVEFHVIGAKHCADYTHSPDRIRVSDAAHDDLSSMLASMAHEMCHLRQYAVAPESEDHGKEWRRLAKAACRGIGYTFEGF